MVLVKRSYLAVVYLLFDILNYVNGLKCFECTLSDKDCGDPIRNEYIERVDCKYSMFTINVNSKRHADEDLFRCLKTIEKNSSNILYTRRCALKEEDVMCDTKHRKGNSTFTIKECSMCDRDFCNSSTMVELGSFYGYLLLAVIIVLSPTNKE